MSSPLSEAQSQIAPSLPFSGCSLTPLIGNQLEWKEYLKANPNIECPYRRHLMMPEFVTLDLEGNMPFTTELFDQKSSQDSKLLTMTNNLRLRDHIGEEQQGENSSEAGHLTVRTTLDW
jgi:hypothetical protein